MFTSSIFFIFVAVLCTGIQESNANPPPHRDDRCPKVDPANPVYLPHETDCHKYYECGNRYAYEFSCPGNLVFNPDINVCDKPEKVNCKSPVSRILKDKILSIQNNKIKQTEEDSTNPPPHKDDRCPAINPAYPVYFPHETDCHKYYECNGGYIYQFSCPGDLMFNPKINVCDKPKNVDCTNPSLKKMIKSKTLKITHLDDRCPLVNPENPILLEHESDCHKFYECNEGWAFELVCPAGLLFNSKLNICDYANNVDCKTGASKQLLKSGHLKITHRDDRCPLVNPQYPIFLAHESDCHKYYECNEGCAFEMICPAGLLFNSKLNTCDYAENVKCDTGK